MDLDQKKPNHSQVPFPTKSLSIYELFQWYLETKTLQKQRGYMDVELQTKNQNQQKETATQQLRAADT